MVCPECGGTGECPTCGCDEGCPECGGWGRLKAILASTDNSCEVVIAVAGKVVPLESVIKQPREEYSSQTKG